MNVRFFCLTLLFLVCLQVLQGEAKRKCRNKKHRHRVRHPHRHRKPTTTPRPVFSESEEDEPTQRSIKGGRGIGVGHFQPDNMNIAGLPTIDVPPIKHRKPGVTLRPIHSKRIVGGKPAEKYLYKSIVALRVFGKTMCGGTLIKSNWVVTAAHCIIPTEDPTNFAVVVAEFQLSVADGFEQLINVKNVFKHKEYNKKSDINDIALLQLERHVKFDDKIQPAVLPDKDFQPQGELTVTGWGALIATKKVITDNLQFVELPLITNKECKDLYPEEDFVITPNHLCTYQRGGGKDACQGDSGGPLYSISEDGVQTLAGVVSWGIGCAEDGNPGVYTRLTSYLDWMEEQFAATKKLEAVTLPPSPPPTKPKGPVWKKSWMIQAPPAGDW